MKLFRKFMLGLALASAALLTVFGVWCNVPLSDPAAFQAILAEVPPPPPEQNGFLALYRMWKPRPPLSLGQLAQELPDPSDRHWGWAHLAKALAAHPEKTRKAVKEAETVLVPGLKAALALPSFAMVPLPEQNLVPIRSTGFSLAALSAYYGIQGRYPAALSVSLLAFTLTDRLWQDPPLLSKVLALAVLSSASEGVVDLLASRRLTGPECGRLLHSLRPLTFSGEVYVEGMDEGLRAGLRELDELATPEGAARMFASFESMSLSDTDLKRLVRILKLPLVGSLYRKRERHIIANNYLGRRSYWLKLDTAPPAPDRPYDLAVKVLYSSDIQSVKQVRKAQVTVEALRVLVGLELHRQKHGHYPARLGELAMPADAPGQFSYQRSGKGCRLEANPPTGKLTFSL